MKHRHLNHEEYTLAGIDDVINCSGRKDWAEMRKAALGNPVVMEKIYRTCQARQGKDPEADARRYGIWRRFIDRNISELMKLPAFQNLFAKVETNFYRNRPNEAERLKLEGTLRTVLLERTAQAWEILAQARSTGTPMDQAEELIADLVYPTLESDDDRSGIMLSEWEKKALAGLNDKTKPFPRVW
jgi:hypothetical protein